MQAHRHTQTLTDSVIVGVHAVVFVITPHSQPFISSHLRHYSQCFHQRKKWACECYNVIKRLWKYLAGVFTVAGPLSCWPGLMYTHKNTHTHTHTLRRVRHVTHVCLISHNELFHWVCQITTLLDAQFPVFWTVSLTHINTKVYPHTHTHTHTVSPTHKLAYFHRHIITHVAQT